MIKRRTLLITSIICALALLMATGGVYAIWRYYDDVEAQEYELEANVDGFNYQIEDMPDEEVTLLQRLDDILNQRYQTEKVIDSRDYLLNETIQVRWEENAPPYVGSMDKNYAEQLDNLFGDVVMETSLSFILKNQDLNWDGYSEISLYSTVDPLDSDSKWPSNAVCVYLSGFTPVLDEQRNIVGYTLVCESLHGYAPEVRYGTEDTTPSFSTDHWRDDIGYMVWNELTNSSDIFRVPADALSNDGTKYFRYDFDSYNKYYQVTWYATTPYGSTAGECLNGKIPWLGWW